MRCIRCGSYAINPQNHGRDSTDTNLCDVCYWRKRAEERLELLEAAKAVATWWDAWIENRTFDQATENAEWYEFKRLRAAINKATGAAP